MTRDEMALRAGEVGDLLRTLANPNRLMIVCTLVEGECSVAKLEAMLGIHQPTLSQQLGGLRAAGLVQTRREAKHVLYRLTDAKAARVVEALYAIFCAEEPDDARSSTARLV